MVDLYSLLNENEAALITNNINRRYLTGFESSLGYLFVTKHNIVLLVDGRYYLAAKQTVKNAEVGLLKNPSEQLKDLMKRFRVDTVLLENTVTVYEFEHFKKMLSDFKVLSDGRMTDRILTSREIKSDFEVDSITKAQRIAEKAFLEVLNCIKCGVTEKRIAAELEYRMKLYGSEQASFDTIVVSGKKSAMPHGVPSDNILKNGDFLTMDFGAVVNGYHSDMTRTVAIGHATDKMQTVYNTVLDAQTAAQSAIKNGIECREVDKVARTVIEKAGYAQNFTHSLGHSVGMQIHETPNLSPKSQAVLKCGNVVTNEPGIYIDDEFGVRIEDMLLVTEKGAVNLTNCEKSLIIL